MARTCNFVNVVNKMDHEYVENYQGEPVRIPKGGSVRMARLDAVAFLGQFPGDKVEKNLETVPIWEDSKPELFVSQLDGKEFDSLEKLNEHLARIRKTMGITK